MKVEKFIHNANDNVSHQKNINLIVTTIDMAFLIEFIKAFNSMHDMTA